MTESGFYPFTECCKSAQATVRSLHTRSRFTRPWVPTTCQECQSIIAEPDLHIGRDGKRSGKGEGTESFMLFRPRTLGTMWLACAAGEGA